MASSSIRRIVLWLRNDLRVHDHEPLLTAIKDAGGPQRARFTLECVADLRESLRELGCGLIVRHARPEDVIPQIAEQYEAKAVYCHAEVTSEELAVEKALSSSINLRRFWGATTLYHLDDLPEEVDPRKGRLPGVFSQFRKRVEADVPSRKILPAPQKGDLAKLPAGLEEGSLPSIEDLCGKGAEAPADPRAVLPFKGGEMFGRERVKYYLWDSDRLATYKDTRDGLVGGDYSSKFAPWLAQGCITSRWIHSEIMRYESERTANKSTYWLVFELLWRDYFRFVAIQSGNDMFKAGGLQHKNVNWRHDKALFEAWRTGKTGFPFVDANMKEIALTGFMSNRGRQNVASFLTKDLQLDWRPGAAWFESCLIDYDVCSNYGNWNYAAGIGNDPREDRHFNIPKQAKTYDPSGNFVKLWLPELAVLDATQVHEPYLLGNHPYIKPVIQHLGRSKMPLDAGGKVFAGSSSQRFRGPPHINEKMREKHGAPRAQSGPSTGNGGGRVQGGYKTMTGAGADFRGKSLRKDSRRDKLSMNCEDQFPAL